MFAFFILFGTRREEVVQTFCGGRGIDRTSEFRGVQFVLHMQIAL